MAQQTTNANQIRHLLAFGAVVTVMAITLEIASMLEVTGYAYAGYHVAGMTIDLTTAYQQVVAIVVVLTIAVMGYGHERITYPPIHR